MKNGLKGIIPAIIWFILITILLVLPGSSFPQENWLSGIYFDKIVLFVMFAVLVFLVCRGLFYSKKWDINPLQAFLFVSFLASVYGLIIEFIQEDFIPNRSFDWFDVVADLSGALFGYVLSLFYYKSKKERVNHAK